MLLLNYLHSGKGNSCVVLIGRAAHPALEGKVLRFFFFRSVFFSSNVGNNNLRVFFCEKKTDLYYTDSVPAVRAMDRTRNFTNKELVVIPDT